MVRMINEISTKLWNAVLGRGYFNHRVNIEQLSINVFSLVFCILQENYVRYYDEEMFFLDLWNS